MNAKSSLRLTGAVTALAGAIARHLTLGEISLLASILAELSDTLNTIVLRESLCKDQNKIEG